MDLSRCPLVLKCMNLESFNNYRPISLCNIVYTLVSKILVTTMRPLLVDLVSPFQTAFVPGRKGVDNAIIFQEIIHTMSKKKGRSGLMAIKINLEKAYDWLECSFIRDTFSLFNFSSQLISLIMSCVLTSSIFILCSGGALEFFLPSKSIRRGDSISPYLFILCMEVLGVFITEKNNSKLWNPVKVSQGGLAFSLFFFFLANDLVLFAKADRKNCMGVRDVLGCLLQLIRAKS